MKTTTIPNSWIQREGVRLDVGPFVSGAAETKVLLEDLPIQKDSLQALTRGYNGGIYNGPQFKRNYVDSPEYGVRFLTGSSMLLADLESAGLLRKEDAHSKKLSYLELEEGTTLISCSGTVGRMLYARPEMAGMWSSQDILKVVPNESDIDPGYLFAYLSSRYGVPLVVSGTYGSIITHLEPRHISGLPVPRLGVDIESRIGSKVRKAASMRDEASRDLKVATSQVAELLASVTDDQHDGLRVQITSSAELTHSCRLEAHFHAGYFGAPISTGFSGKQFVPMKSIADVFDVPMFKHIYVDEEYGTPFYTSGALFKVERKTDKHLSRKKTVGLHKYVLDRNWLLLARSGQVGGIIGRIQYADSALEGATASDHVIRIVPREKDIAGYLYAYLNSGIGYETVVRTACGTSIPALYPVQLEGMPVFIPGQETVRKIHLMVADAFERRIQASGLEDEAREMLEGEILSLASS